MRQRQFEALQAIVDERKYQDYRWANSDSGGHHEIAAYLAFIQHYVTRAIDEATDDNPDVVHSIRKIAALAVACMEDNGAASRHYGEEIPF